MKPRWAHFETTCSHCEKTIMPKSTRLDDQFRYRNITKREHFHVECYFNFVKEWFEKNPFSSKLGAGGRPPLNISEEDKVKRRSVLNRLNSLKQYYLPRLNFDVPMVDLDPKDLKRFQTFHRNRQKLIEQLKNLGGIPEFYAASEIPLTTLGDISNNPPEKASQILDNVAVE